MRAYAVVASLVLCGLVIPSAWGAQVDSSELESVFKALKAPNATEAPNKLYDDNGFIRFVGAPPGGVFEAPSKSKGKGTESLATGFLDAHKGAFGSLGSKNAFVSEKKKSKGSSDYLRYQQTYNSIPVFGGEVMVQVDSTKGGVACVYANILTDTAKLDDGTVSTTATVTAEAAKQAAITWMASKYSVAASTLTATTPGKYIFEPTVLGAPGSLCLTWRVEVHATTKQAAEVLFVNASTGSVAFHYSLVENLRNRKIYDADGQYTTEVADCTLARAEGSTASGIADVDYAYTFFGDTYDFYFNYHGRDSINNAGMPMVAIVRSAEESNNAAWYTGMDKMVFGAGFASADDVVAHELTHGVTEYESNLTYWGQPGAINEAFSDIWGEFVDLTNGHGLDTGEVRWLCGEDLSTGAIRSLKNPPLYEHPDKLSSEYYIEPSGDSIYAIYDNGGVHENSGIINKLAYLLTDGGAFNGRSITGMGMEKVAKLLYEMQTNLLISSSKFADYAVLMRQAGINLGMSYTERLNIVYGTYAVEIADPVDYTYVAFRAVPTTQLGRPVVTLTWVNPDVTNFQKSLVVRNAYSYPENISDGTEIYRGSETYTLDRDVVLGQTYYYTLFQDFGDGFTVASIARVVATATAPGYMTESYSESNPCDLQFSQYTFTPTGAPFTSEILDQNQAPDYSNYLMTRKASVSSFPVARTDDDGAAIELIFREDGHVGIDLDVPFPFFGTPYQKLIVAGNGYLCFEQPTNSTQSVWPYLSSYSYLNFPSLTSHFDLQRISFLFDDLLPASGGAIWKRTLSDRYVVTFDGVSEKGNTEINKVQVELFYSGKIRITYLDVNVTEAIVGLSDGRATPINPVDLPYSNITSVPATIDFTSVATTASGLTLDPIAASRVGSGDIVEFTAKTNRPTGAAIPTLTASWTKTDAVPFADNGDGTGTFYWQTTSADVGASYTIRITAKSGSLITYQDVTVIVSSGVVIPEATDLKLSTSNSVEDSSADRVISTDVNLYANYTITNPSSSFTSVLMWYKNNQLVSTYTGERTVPSGATTANDVWFFTVTPTSLTGAIVGETKISPKVTVVVLPVVNQVLLVEKDSSTGVATGNYTENPSGPPEAYLTTPSGKTYTVQIQIVGERLGHPLSVKIGGINALGIRAVDDEHLIVTVPAHIPSLLDDNGDVIPEDIVVETSEGITVAYRAFTYVSSTATVKADVNGDGVTNAVDIQLVILDVLQMSKGDYATDVNSDGNVNSTDIQLVVNAAMSK